MNPHAATDALDSLRQRAANRRPLRLAGAALGLCLFAGALWVAFGQRAAVFDAFSAALKARWWLALAAFALPAVGWSLTSVMYWLLMNRDDLARQGIRVGLREMHAVLGAAWIMNYLPARPGMFGRVAYHAAINKFPLGFVIASSVAAVVCGIVSVGLLLASTLLLRHRPGATMTAVALAAPALLCVAAAVLCKLLTPTNERWWRSAAACGLRSLDCLTWAARYWCVYAILGVELTLPQAAALTAVSQAAAMVPFVGNGLGVREWAVGVVGPLLPGVGQGLSRETALSGDVINRGCELLAALVIGVPSVLLVARRLRNAGLTLSAAPSPR